MPCRSNETMQFLQVGLACRSNETMQFLQCPRNRGMRRRPPDHKKLAGTSRYRPDPHTTMCNSVGGCGSTSELLGSTNNRPPLSSLAIAFMS